MRLLPAALAAVALLAAGCGAGPSPTPPSPSASAPGPVSSSAVAPSAPASTAAALPADTAELPPARDASPDAVPGVAFELETGWSSGDVADGTIELRHDAGVGGVGVTIGLLRVGSAVEAAGLVRALPGVAVLAASDARMGGLTGPNLELEHDGGDGETQVVSTTTGSIAIAPGQRVWLSMFDTPGGVVAIAVRSDAADWDAALLAAEPFLETVTFGG